MIFKIDPPGTDYTRVTLDVPHDQLTDVIHAVTTINRTALDRAAGRRAAWAAASGTLSEETRADAQAVSDRPPFWLVDMLTRPEKETEAPRCRTCSREVSFRDRKSGSGAVIAVDFQSRRVCTVCRRCAADGRAQRLDDALRPVAPGSDLVGELAGVRLPALDAEVKVIRLGDASTHVVLTPFVEARRDGASEGGRRHRSSADPDHLGVTVVPAVLEPEATSPVDNAGPGEAQKQADVVLGLAVEVQLDGRLPEGDGQRDGGLAHGCSSCGGRCAGATRPDGTGDAEPTRVEALLEELLAEVRAHAPKPWLTVRDSTAFERHVGGVRSDDAQAPDEGPDCGERGDAR